MTSDIHHYDDGKPLNRSETVKRQLERDAARLFMRAYEKQHGIPIRDIWHNEPAKPDVSCHLDGQPLDLEVAHLYASSSEAKILTHHITQQVEPGAEPSSESQELRRYLQELTELDVRQRLQVALGNILKQKSKKHYLSERVWLIIRNVSPLWQSTDFLGQVHQLLLPSHPFEQIWLLPDYEGQQPLIRLF